MNVVIVESPTKATTINKYLGSDYKVLASYGHVRDLPPKDGSVRPDEDFAMDWIVTEGSEKNLRAIGQALKAARDGTYPGKIVIYLDIDCPLTSAASLTDGRPWSAEAEQTFLART